MKSRLASRLRAAALSLTIVAAMSGGARAAADAPAASTAPAAPSPVFEHPADADALNRMLGPVTKPLTAAAALSGNFVQRKQLSEVPRPLQSSGEFFVARGLGVDWHTRKPFEGEILITPQALIQKSAGGQVQRTDAGRQPGLQAVSQIFDALFALDVPKLSETFTLFGQPAASAGGDWTLGLIPREPAFAKIMSHIVVVGGAQPKHIVLYEANGDRTEIDFEQVVTHSSLSEADRQRFVAP